MSLAFQAGAEDTVHRGLLSHDEKPGPERMQGVVDRSMTYAFMLPSNEGSDITVIFRQNNWEFGIKGHCGITKSATSSHY